MDSSILDDVKKIIGVHSTDDDFDQDIIIDINTVLFALNQMGIGKEGYMVKDVQDTWADFIKPNEVNLFALKTWVGLKVKSIFDPPTSAVLAEALEKSIKEYEWRMYITENYVGEI